VREDKRGTGPHHGKGGRGPGWPGRQEALDHGRELRSKRACRSLAVLARLFVLALKCSGGNVADAKREEVGGTDWPTGNLTTKVAMQASWEGLDLEGRRTSAGRGAKTGNG